MRVAPFLAVLAVAAVLSGCGARPGPHPRALESNELCALYITRGELTPAEDQCDLGLQFSPDYADLWVNKGIIAFNRGQDDKAKGFFIKALRLNQDQAQAYNNLGMLYMKELKYGTAGDNFRAALKVNPDYLEARYNLALAYMALKKFEEGKKELRTITQIQPNLADAWGQLGQIALDESENEAAVEYLTRATQLDPRFTAAWLGLGNAFMEAGKPCDGKDAYSSCIEVEADNAQCRNNIIIAEKRCKLQDKALADVRGREDGTRTPESEYSAALHAREQGLVNDEERSYKRCLRLDAKFSLCHFGLFELFRSRSDMKNATIACQNFIKFAQASEYRTQYETCQQFVGE